MGQALPPVERLYNAPVTPRTALEGLAFPECPRWHDNALYFSDMHAGVVWRLDERGATKVLDLPMFPGVITPTEVMEALDLSCVKNSEWKGARLLPKLR